MISLLKDIRSVLGTNIKSLRKSQRLTQEELAEKAAISLRTFQGIELGQTWPEFQSIESISRALGTDGISLFQIKVESDFENLSRFLREISAFSKEELEDLFEAIDVIKSSSSLEHADEPKSQKKNSTR